MTSPAAATAPQQTPDPRSAPQLRAGTGATAPPRPVSLVRPLRPASRASAPTTPRLVHATLGAYEDASGSARELILLPGAEGSHLLVDRLCFRGLDARLLVHLAADEPLRNARLVADMYLVAPSARTSRALREDDLLEPPQLNQAQLFPAAPLRAAHGSTVSIEVVERAFAPELRWVRRPLSAERPAELLSVRDVVGLVEQHGTVRRITLGAVRQHRGTSGASTATLSAELRRLDNSPIVLNRGLRHAVLRAVSREAVSLSAIAMRCGRIKRDRHGNTSGETSWLARRIGLLADGGSPLPTPWIHSDVLALIARQGLGIAPREVEVS